MRLTPRKPIRIDRSSFFIKVAGLSILAAILKIGLLALEVIPFNADEAIVALMARHTIAGKWSTFFYGQAYMGSLDTSLVAVGFLIFGQKVIVIRGVQILLYSLTVITTAILGRMIFRSDKVGLLAALFLVIPTVNTTLYTTISLGGYGEALLIGNLLMIVSMKVSRERSNKWYALWGLLAGLGFWSFGITMVFILPTAVLIGYQLTKRKIGQAAGSTLVGIGFVLLGAAPLVLWGIENGFVELWREFFGSAISGASDSNLFIAIYEHTLNLLLFGSTVIFGLRPPWTFQWLAIPLIPFALAFWLIVIGLSIRKLRDTESIDAGKWVLVGIAITLMVGFIFTPFGADPSGRYFLPLLVPMVLFAAEAIIDLTKRGNASRWVGIMVAGILVFNLWGTIQSAAQSPPGITTQFDRVTWIDHSYDRELIQFLEENNTDRGYSNYWVSYPLAFLSHERIIFVPKLPYHEDFRYTDRDNRYDPYNQLVDQADRIAYITTNHPELDDRLESKFDGLGITWNEAWIGDYHVYYELSTTITPEELDIYDLAE
jgi:4-amino-4-deoxy-L-arabinose transferase-like glycosyltransferase